MSDEHTPRVTLLRICGNCDAVLTWDGPPAWKYDREHAERVEEAQRFIEAYPTLGAAKSGTGSDELPVFVGHIDSLIFGSNTKLYLDTHPDPSHVTCPVCEGKVWRSDTLDDDDLRFAEGVLSIARQQAGGE